MKTRYFGFAAIVVLQACSTASTSEVNVEHAVEPTAKVECKPIASFLARYTQDLKIYRWEDEEDKEDHEFVLQKIRDTRQVIERYEEDFTGSGEDSCLSSN